MASSLSDGGLRKQDIVRRELGRVLESPVFRGSRRCQEFLKFVVDAVLEGRADSIKERNLGIAVFGRDPAYDTGEDAIVRVKANDVRKRLAQYYVESNQSSPVRIELPAGSYIPAFQFPESDAEQQPGKAEKVRLAVGVFPPRLLAGIGVAVALAALTLVLVWRWRPQPDDKTFWAPMLNRDRPVVICLGQPVVYLLSKRIHLERMAGSGIQPERGPYVLPISPKEVLGQDLVPVTDQYVGVGSARAAVNFAAWLSRHGQNCEMRAGNDLPFTDLRNAPVILVGGLNNAWTQELTKHLRYRFEFHSDLTKVVRDSQSGREWVSTIAPDGKTPQDFSIVTRLRYSVTGQTLVSAAGTTQYGTHSASEFLTDATQLRAALRTAPAKWINCQFVLSTRIVRGAPAAPEVIATHFW
jgi:hypothetical protein